MVGGGGGEGDAVAEEGTLAAGECWADSFGHSGIDWEVIFLLIDMNWYFLFLLQGFIGDIISL